MTFDDVLNWVEARNTTPTHRQLLWLNGEPVECYANALSIMETVSEDSASVWIGKTADTPQCAIDYKHYQTFLGNDYSLVIYNAFGGFKPDVFLALCGCIPENGLLVLLSPSKAKWADYLDPIQATWLSHGHEFKASLYNSFIAEKLANTAQVAHFNANGRGFLPEATADDTEPRQWGVFRTQDQAEAFDLLKQSCSNTPILLSAKRGRGKSTLLGLFIADQLSRGNHINLTSISRRSVDSIFKGIGFAKQSIDIKANSAIHQRTGAICQWLANDNPNLYTSSNITIVDEAAANSLIVLNKLKDVHNSLILATTTDGYEGSRAGYQLKFIPDLISQFPDTRQLSLAAPIRWHRDDWMEPFTESLFAINSHFSHIEHSNKDTVELVTLTKKALLADRQWCHLLASSHYQTSPDDLARIVNAPEIRVFAAKQNQKLLGLVIVIEEGGERLSDLADDVSSGMRRPRGHLGAQSLSMLGADPVLATTPSWRINRIAIHPSIQRRGLGSKVLAYIREQANAENITLLTTSFAHTDSVYQFWESNRFLPVRLGKKIDNASGTSSTLMFSGDANYSWLSSLAVLDDELGTIDDFYTLTITTQHAVNKCMTRRLQQFLLGKRNLIHLGFSLEWFVHANSIEVSRLPDLLRQYIAYQYRLGELFNRNPAIGKKEVIKNLSVQVKEMLSQYAESILQGSNQ